MRYLYRSAVPSQGRAPSQGMARTAAAPGKNQLEASSNPPKYAHYDFSVTRACGLGLPVVQAASTSADAGPRQMPYPTRLACPPQPRGAALQPRCVYDQPCQQGSSRQKRQRRLSAECRYSLAPVPASPVPWVVVPGQHHTALSAQSTLAAHNGTVKWMSQGKEVLLLAAYRVSPQLPETLLERQLYSTAC